MKKLIFCLLVVALLATMSNANAKTYHIYKLPKSARLTSVGKYAFTYHRLATIKCPYFGCRRGFSHN